MNRQKEIAEARERRRGQHHLFITEVRAAFDSLIVIHGHHTELHVVLRVRLADVDHIEVSRAAPELRMGRVILVRIRTGDPRDAIVRIGVKLSVIKIDVELS